MFSPTVQLKSGGYIVINQTEALVAIDVNSGRSTREHHIEDTALKTNIEASEEVARQLRLRDLAGLIVIDYIDMDEKRNNRTVERRLKDALRNDRARIQVGRISHFGLMEMSRQRIRTSVLESSTEKCPHCGGTGHVRSVSSVALQLLRSIEETLLKGPTHNLIIRTLPDTALYVLNHKRAHLRGLEERFKVTLTVNSDEEVGGQIGYTIDRGEQVMTLDQAKALLAQAAADAPALHEDEEPDFPEEIDETSEAEAGESEHVEHAGNVDEMPDTGDDHQPMHGDRQNGDRPNGDGARQNGDGSRDGRGRRRRRRGRGGRDRGEGREGGSFAPRQEHGSPEAGEAPHDQAPSFAQPEGGEFAPDGTSPDQGFAPRPRPEGGEHTNGDGEVRRRRRGRRGGRRNRRDGAPGNGDFAAQGHDTQGQPEAGERTEWSPPQETSQPATPEPTYAPRIEPAPRPEPAAVAASAPPPSAAEPPRRRSTVREPAPVFSGSAPVVTPTPAPPPPEPTVISTAEADASKPKKSGWWAKRLLGG
jgi:ribonuclease E